jgi:uncharacterized protein YecT (DUF1311 family)
MLIEGQGGAQDVPGAKIALAGCFEDITVTSLRERIDLPHAAGAPYDFCKDNGGTTITTDECTALAGKKTELDGEKLAKSTYARLPPAARPLYGKVAVAWTRFAVADAWLIHDTERGGTIRASAALRSQQIREGERQRRIATILDYQPKPASTDAALVAADADLDAARAAMRKAATDDEQRTMIKDAEDAWLAYRDAETALYVAAFGDRFGPAAVRADVGISLARARITCSARRHAGYQTARRRRPTGAARGELAARFLWRAMGVLHAVLEEEAERSPGDRPRANDSRRHARRRRRSGHARRGGRRSPPPGCIRGSPLPRIGGGAHPGRARTGAGDPRRRYRRHLRRHAPTRGYHRDHRGA